MSRDRTIYDKSSIESLDPREHVRKRSGMYIGSNETPNQLLLEIFSNALDEHCIGHGDVIDVHIEKDGTCGVRDYGQGFLVNEVRPEDGKTILEASFSVVNTSGKFNDNGVYAGSSLGLNGLGGKLTNFLSEHFTVATYRDGEYEQIEFKDGEFVKRDTGKSTEPNGTMVEYKPDAQFFGTGMTDIAHFRSFFHDIACLCPRLTINFNGESIHHSSIEDFLGLHIGDREDIVSSHFVNEQSGFSAAMTFTSAADSSVIAYVNYGATTSGPHITGVKSAITRVFNNWARSKGILKDKDKNLDGASIQEGLLLVCNITSTGVVYNSQTKEKVVSLDTSFLEDFSTQLEVWLDSNPQDGRAIIEKALVARKATEAARKAREAVKKKAEGKGKKLVMPSKLADCHSKNRRECELYVTEGDSASGGAKLIRNASTQAILGLKGKVLNCLVATPRQIMKNAEVVDIIKALGFDYDFTEQYSVVHYDPKKLRYGKFIIAADRDSDGSHIQLLVLSLLWKLVPQMVKDGYVYVALPPLYKAEWGTKYRYLQDKQELDKFSKSHKEFTLTYFKGLGEASPQELGNMIIDPSARKLAKVTVADAQAADKIINDLMGADAAPKKAFVFGEEE